MKIEKVAILLLDNFSRSFCKGKILILAKDSLRYGKFTRISSFAHVAYEGMIDEHFKVLDFIEDPDNISNHEIESTQMLYPDLEVVYERTI